ncbi:MAG: acylphosphatase [Candidatus Pacearchaeota archaeon]|jgi:acylphosphatase
MKKAAKITIHGNVQGVFFRNYIKEKADSLGLKGFVRNLEGGDVELVVEGDIDHVDKMHELCRQAPKHAVISSTELKEIEFQDFTEFQILHI